MRNFAATCEQGRILLQIDASQRDFFCKPATSRVRTALAPTQPWNMRRGMKKNQQLTKRDGLLGFLASHQGEFTALGAILSPVLLVSWNLASSLADIKTQIGVAQTSVATTQNSLDRLERNQLLLQSDIRAVDSRVSSLEARVSELSMSVAVISRDVAEGLKSKSTP